MRVFGFVDHETGNEGANRQRQAKPPGDISHTKRDRGGREQEQLARVPSRNKSHQSRHDASRYEEDDAEQHERANGCRDDPRRTPAALFNSGNTIINGTTARSWTTRIPSITRLESVPSRPCA